MTMTPNQPNGHTPAQSLAISRSCSDESALYSIAESLRAIAHQMGPSSDLGFVQPPKATWVYANRTQGDRWYWRTPEGNYELCPTAALSGRLVSLDFREMTRRNQPVWKLHTTLEADRTYIIEAGRDSVFAKSLLAAIATLSSTTLRQPIILEVHPADQNEESLFCNLYVEGERVYGSWGDQPDWTTIANKAMTLVAQAHQ